MIIIVYLDKKKPNELSFYLDIIFISIFFLIARSFSERIKLIFDKIVVLWLAK